MEGGSEGRTDRRREVDVTYRVQQEDISTAVVSLPLRDTHLTSAPTYSGLTEGGRERWREGGRREAWDCYLYSSAGGYLSGCCFSSSERYPSNICSNILRVNRGRDGGRQGSREGGREGGKE